MADLFLELVFGLLGAFIGVIWPAKTPEWARWQKIGITLGVVGLISFSTMIVVVQFNGSSAMIWTSIVVTLISLTGFVVIGNICRHFHEGR